MNDLPGIPTDCAENEHKCQSKGEQEMETTTLRYELSGDNQGLKKWFRGKSGEENFYHVHADEMTELERWIHGLLSSPNYSLDRPAASAGTVGGLVLP
jgi:hypothetical protein